MNDTPRDTDDPADPTASVDHRARHWGPLEILERIDSGPFFTLYRARHTILGRNVALRLFNVGNDEQQQRLIEDGRKMARIRHPNIVQVLGADVHDGVVGIWSELIAGKPLADSAANNGPMRPDETIKAGRQLCAALATLHGAGLYCPRLDAANILREDEGGARLDFFSMAADETAPDSSADTGADERIDIRALGILLFRLATGTYPPPGDGGNLPEPLLACLERAVAKDPNDRFPDAGTFGKALAKAGKRPVSRVRRVAGVTIILLLSVLVIMQWPSQYRLESTVYRMGDDDNLTRLAPGEPVAVGDCLVLEVETTVPMYVYVFSEDTRGAATGRFPQPNSSAENPLAPDMPHDVAMTRGASRCWHADRAGEFTRLHILASPEPVPEFRSLYLDLPQTGVSNVDIEPLIETAHDLDAKADAAIGVTYTVLDLHIGESTP